MSRTAAKDYIFLMEITHITPVPNSGGKRTYISMDFLFLDFSFQLLRVPML